MPATTRLPSHGPRRAVLGWWAALVLVLAVALSHGLGAEGPSGHHRAGLTTAAHQHDHESASHCPATVPDPGSDSDSGHGSHVCLAGQPAQGVDLHEPAPAPMVTPIDAGAWALSWPGVRPVPRPPPADTPSPGRLRI